MNWKHKGLLVAGSLFLLFNFGCFNKEVGRNCRSPPKFMEDHSNNDDIVTYRKKDYLYKSVKLRNCYDDLMQYVDDFLQRQIENNMVRFDSLEKIYSGITLNEEIGLAVLLYKYNLQEQENLGYLIVVSNDSVGRSDLANRFNIIGNSIMSYNIEDIISRLKESYDSPKNRIAGDASGNTIDLNKLKDYRTLYVAVPYSGENGEDKNLIYIVSVSNINAGIKVSGTGNGVLTLEEKF